MIEAQHRFAGIRALGRGAHGPHAISFPRVGVPLCKRYDALDLPYTETTINAARRAATVHRESWRTRRVRAQGEWLHRH